MKYSAERKESILKKMMPPHNKPLSQLAEEEGISEATLYNWRRAYGGMDTDAAKELKELREQNGRLKRLLAEAELEKDALREVAKGKF